jgi:hypothetical protein
VAQYGKHHPRGPGKKDSLQTVAVPGFQGLILSGKSVKKAEWRISLFIFLVNTVWYLQAFS